MILLILKVKNLKVPNWVKILSKKEYKNFPPFLELYLLEFSDKQSLDSFLKNNEN